MPSKRKRTNPSEQKSQIIRGILPFVFSLVLTVGLSGGLCAIAANAMCTTDLAPALLIPLTTVLICIALLIASLFLSAIFKGGILAGTLFASVLILLLSLLSFLLYQSSFTSLWATKTLAFLASGALGGYLGSVLRERRRKIRR